MSAKSQELIQAILDQRKNSADLKDLATGFLAKWDGVDGIMKELKLTYDNSVTATDKTKILLAGIDLIKQVSAAGGKDDLNLDDLDEKELRIALRESIKEE